MPSLADTLDQLRTNSNHIEQLSRCNIRPSGPITTAYLKSSTLDLIRDGSTPEIRLFKYIGETSDNVKKVEKKEGPVTPLKELGAGRARGGKEEIEQVLRTAGRLVEDYRPMPRARNHIAALTEQHQKQSRKIVELEKLIEELSKPSQATDQTPLSPAPLGPPRSKPTLTADEAIAAEDASLKAIEAYLRQHREAATQAIPDPPTATSPVKQPSPVRAQYDTSPIRSRPSIFAQTPGGKTPMRDYPHVSNSLVDGTTPHRSTKINRFGELSKIATPRRERGSIFGARPPRSVSGQGAKKSFAMSLGMVSPVKSTVEEGQEVVRDVQDFAGDETVRLPSQEIPRPISPAAEEDDEPTPQPSPVKLASPIKGPRAIHGIQIDNEAIPAAINRIRTSYPDLLGGNDPDQSVEQAIEHLHQLSTSEPEYVPSSDQSAASTISSTPSIPITKESISLSIICLIVLASPGLAVPMNEFKESFAATIRGKGWDEMDSTKMAFKLIARKLMKIDRSGSYGANGALRIVLS